jgi:bifunctional non-homologous end joining protein LigD
VEAIQALRCDCIIDGEVVVVDDNGLASFDRLRYGSKVNQEAVLYAFDLLELEGEDFRSAPLEERKTGLKRLLGLKRRSKTTSVIHYVDHLEFDDAALRTGLRPRLRRHRVKATRLEIRPIA